MSRAIRRKSPAPPRKPGTSTSTRLALAEPKRCTKTLSYFAGPAPGGALDGAVGLGRGRGRRPRRGRAASDQQRGSDRRGFIRGSGSCGPPRLYGCASPRRPGRPTRAASGWPPKRARVEAEVARRVGPRRGDRGPSAPALDLHARGDRAVGRAHLAPDLDAAAAQPADHQRHPVGAPGGLGRARRSGAGRCCRRPRPRGSGASKSSNCATAATRRSREEQPVGLVDRARVRRRGSAPACGRAGWSGTRTRSGRCPRLRGIRPRRSAVRISRLRRLM